MDAIKGSGVNWKRMQPCLMEPNVVDHVGMLQKLGESCETECSGVQCDAIEASREFFRERCPLCNNGVQWNAVLCLTWSRIMRNHGDGLVKSRNRLFLNGLEAVGPSFT